MCAAYEKNCFRGKIHIHIQVLAGIEAPGTRRRGNLRQHLEQNNQPPSAITPSNRLNQSGDIGSADGDRKAEAEEKYVARQILSEEDGENTCPVCQEDMVR
jgi:hypothetical protein